MKTTNWKGIEVWTDFVWKIPKSEPEPHKTDLPKLLEIDPKWSKEEMDQHIEELKDACKKCTANQYDDLVLKLLDTISQMADIIAQYKPPEPEPKFITPNEVDRTLYAVIMESSKGSLGDNALKPAPSTVEQLGGTSTQDLGSGCSFTLAYLSKAKNKFRSATVTSLKKRLKSARKMPYLNTPQAVIGIPGAVENKPTSETVIPDEVENTSAPVTVIPEQVEENSPTSKTVIPDEVESTPTPVAVIPDEVGENTLTSETVIRDEVESTQTPVAVITEEVGENTLTSETVIPDEVESTQTPVAVIPDEVGENTQRLETMIPVKVEDMPTLVTVIPDEVEVTHIPETVMLDGAENISTLETNSL